MLVYLCRFRLKHEGSVVQLVRIRACHARGRGFEPRPDRKKHTVKTVCFFYLILFQLLSKHPF
jgi:hypothetical protein